MTESKKLVYRRSGELVPEVTFEPKFSKLQTKKFLFCDKVELELGGSSTLADANNIREWRIFAEFAHLVLSQATKLYANEKLGVNLKAAAYCLDASVINLCFALCPWSKFDRTSRGGVQLHARRSLLHALAGRNFLQVDQATLAH